MSKEKVKLRLQKFSSVGAVGRYLYTYSKLFCCCIQWKFIVSTYHSKSPLLGPQGQETRRLTNVDIFAVGGVATPRCQSEVIPDPRSWYPVPGWSINNVRVPGRSLTLRLSKRYMNILTDFWWHCSSVFSDWWPRDVRANSYWVLTGHLNNNFSGIMSNHKQPLV